MSKVPSADVGLRRVPRQARSRARVDAIIAALVELVAESADPGALTTADVAARAGLPLGSLYEYFEDLAAIVDAAVVRMLDRHDALLAEVAAQPADTVDGLTDQLFDHYLRLYREQPAFVSLRNSVLFQPYQRTWLGDRVREFVRRIIDTAVGSGLFVDSSDLAERLDVVFVIGDALVQASYRSDRAGNPRVIAEGRAILRLAVGRVASGASSEAE